MNFFQSLAELTTEKLRLSIAVSQENGTSVITIKPEIVGSQNHWPPFVMRGEASELDQEFEKKLQDFKEALGVIANSESYLEKVKKEAADKQRKTTTATTATTKKDDKKDDKKEDKKPDKKEDKKSEKKEEEEGLEIFS